MILGKILAQNRKAFHDYTIHDRLESGIILLGSEVKSLRSGKSSLGEAFVIEKDGDLFLHNMHISEYLPAKLFGHPPKRERKLLLHKKEIRRLIGKITRKGLTLIPLKIYLNEKGKIKVELALALGNKNFDKRQILKEKEWKRQKQRIFKKSQLT